MSKTNKVEIAGEIVSEPEFSFNKGSIEMYKAMVKVQRDDCPADVLPVIMPKGHVGFIRDNKMERIGVNGTLRSHGNLNKETGRYKVELFIQSKVITDERDVKNKNNVMLEGFICNEPRLRVNNRGVSVCDTILAVNTSMYYSDYIPIVCWGTLAQYMGRFEVGDKVKAVGRFQSREYTKKLEDGTSEVRTAYEMSCADVYKMEVNNRKKETV